MNEMGSGPRSVRKVVNARYDCVIHHKTQASPKAETAWKTTFKCSGVMFNFPSPKLCGGAKRAANRCMHRSR